MKEKIKAKVYREDSNGNLEIQFFNPKIIFKESEHQGKLQDGRPVFMTIIEDKEVWYLPYKYQKGES